MKTIDPREHPVPFVHRTLLSGVAPRPIALVGSIDSEGRHNLAPFSFFNAFGANPPVIVVSPSYRGKDGTSKHTFENIRENGEFTVSTVSFDMVRQINLASADFPQGVDEFQKAGFTKLPSDTVRPPGVAESPFVMECRLLEHFDTGGKPGSGNLLIAEVLRFHIRESAFEGERIDPRRLDLVARMGYNWYCRANGDALFELPKPSQVGMGIDALPEHIRVSSIFTGSDLAMLAGVASIPDADAVLARWQRMYEELLPEGSQPDLMEVELRTGTPQRAVTALLRAFKYGAPPMERVLTDLQRCAQAALHAEDVDFAWECATMAQTARLSALPQ
ncbi:flavin reductase family protein [bacterium]|nr:flavin reductase family protein [bacterium]